MAKYKPQIYFHNKKMNLLEASLYLCALKTGFVNLNLSDEEEKDYLKWKEYKEEKNERARELAKVDIFKNLNKNKYLIENLERKIKSEKLVKNKIYCKEHGHKEEKDSAYTNPGVDGAVKHYTCLRCGAIYEKERDQKEDMGLIDKVYNPFKK
jgi:hypothetical protein